MALKQLLYLILPPPLAVHSKYQLICGGKNACPSSPLKLPLDLNIFPPVFEIPTKEKMWGYLILPISDNPLASFIIANQSLPITKVLQYRVNLLGILSSAIMPFLVWQLEPHTMLRAA